MRKILFIFSFCFLCFGCATTSTNYADITTREARVFNFSGISQTELFIRTNLWFVQSFKSANAVVEFSDKDTGTLAGKFITNQLVTGTLLGPDKVKYIVLVNVKDNAIRFTLQVAEVGVLQRYGHLWRTPTEYEFKKINLKKTTDVISNEFINFVKSYKEF